MVLYLLSVHRVNERLHDLVAMSCLYGDFEGAHVSVVSSGAPAWMSSLTGDPEQDEWNGYDDHRQSD